MAAQAVWRHPVCKQCGRGDSSQTMPPHARFPVFTLHFNFNFRILLFYYSAGMFVLMLIRLPKVKLGVWFGSICWNIPS
jgi:hypothetical protein